MTKKIIKIEYVLYRLMLVIHGRIWPTHQSC